MHGLIKTWLLVIFVGKYGLKPFGQFGIWTGDLFEQIFSSKVTINFTLLKETTVFSLLEAAALIEGLF